MQPLMMKSWLRIIRPVGVLVSSGALALLSPSLGGGLPSVSIGTVSHNISSQFSNQFSSQLVPSQLVSSQLVADNAAYAQQSEEQTSIQVYQSASPAVVSIRTNNSAGSGSIIDSRGLVLTNAHVVNSARRVTVILSDKRQFTGRVLVSSRNPDLALIQLQNVTQPLPTLKLSRDPVQVGQRAFAIGTPFGRFAGTLTTGIISRIDTDRNLLQTDAALNPGNSGGPLLNSRGEIVGVNTAIFTSSSSNSNIGIGFAINVSTVQQFLATAPRGTFVATNPERQRPVPLTFNGKIITDRLTEQDAFFPDGSFYRTYQFMGKAGQRITLEMQSTEVDPYLILFGPNNTEIAQNTRISTVLPADGLYTLHANGYERGQTGKYRLLARIENPNNAANSSSRTQQDSSGNQNLSSQNSEGTQTNLPTNQQLIATNNGGVFNGVFDSNSRVAQDATLFQLFNFNGQRGQTWRITMTSSEFKPELLLFNPRRQLLRRITARTVANNTNQATMMVQLPADGNYQLIAKTTNADEQGKYNLTMARVR